MKKYYDTNPTYSQLTPFGKCIIDELTERQLRQAANNGYKSSESYIEAFNTLRTVQLAFVHISDIAAELNQPDNKYRDILPNCNRSTAKRSH